MRKLVFAFCLLISTSAFAQQYSLYNTRTLFDAFENPSQRAFQPDSSKQFAFNFFVPTIGLNAAAGGQIGITLKRLLFEDEVDGSGLALGQQKKSKIFANLNTYLLMFRGYTSLKGNEEVGLSWQIRSENQATVTNETAAIFDDYSLFDQDHYSGLFNDKGFSQSYNQISFTYRRDSFKDYDRRLGIGMKFSYLSGIQFNDIKITKSQLDISSESDYYKLYINGRYRTNNRFDDASGAGYILPGFKNPGFSFTGSMNYKFKYGWFLLANLKDIGFIHWNKNSYVYSLNRDISISNASASDTDKRLADELDFNAAYKNEGFTTLINGKAEVLISKDYGVYKPNLLLSKSLFYDGGDAVLINRLNINNLNFSLSTGYNTAKIAQVGTQFLYKTPNSEFYIGSDQTFTMAGYIQGLIKNDPSFAKGHPGASFYIGFSKKFGYVIEHPMNANRIPGFNTELGFFGRLFGKLGIR